MNWDVRSLEDSLYLIPLMPMLGALVLRLAGRQLGKTNVSTIACSTVLASFALSLAILVPMAFPALVGGTAPLAIGFDHGVWFGSGGIAPRAALYVDHLNAILLAVVTGVSLLIHIYSTEYMKDEPDYHRYFSYLNLFVGFMLVLVLANDLVLMFVGWEGVGLCSYLLIGFWFEDDAKAYAGRKAFVVNRIGDFGFLLGIFTLIALFGSTAINPFVGRPGLTEAALGIALDAPVPTGVLKTLGMTYGSALTMACLLLFVGAVGKSAQIPLYVWLPDAMAGPTPVSALIHAATMVTAGVYMIARLSVLFSLSPAAMATVASVGAATALFAALMGFAQNDIKKVLAYSTVSQLGFMVLGVGIGAYWQGVFHLVTHAFFKALLFLAAGSVILGCHHEQDIRRMGGLRGRMRSTAWTFLIGTIAITGVLPLSGFFSKDEILHFAEGAQVAGWPHLGHVVYAVGTLAAFCTAFYMFRLYFLVFEGTPRSEKATHAAESGIAVKVALWTLAAASVLAAVWGLPLIRFEGRWQYLFENFTAPVFGPANGRLGVGPSLFAGPGEFLREMGVAFLVALAVAWAGLALAFWLYRRDGNARVGRVLKPGNFVYDLVANKFYVDEAYDLLIVLPFRALSFALWEVVDVLAIDGLAVRGTAFLTGAAGKLLRGLQNGDAQRYAAVIAVAVVAIVWALTF